MFTYPRFFFIAAIAAISVSPVHGAITQQQPEVLDLQADLQRRKPESPRSSDAIERIKQLIVSQQSPRRGQECEECPICLDALKSTVPDMQEEAVCKLSTCGCPIKYHASCVKAWLEVRKVCPVCYAKVSENDLVSDQDEPASVLQVVGSRKELVILLPDGKLNN